ncbi:hypothetical protein CTZ28_13640 [Streptomyces shenzhenensis]|uniref:Glycosyl hydrolase family 32 N-terminal domain-containing protein n=1 Tax=Streptomyces shenzhenensis TaxID=943815 RepID=A0A3M0I6L8_9ACTN|nr:hypothetical protein CTZ28_13640 [Streptomyces shenzhenensis]
MTPTRSGRRGFLVRGAGAVTGGALLGTLAGPVPRAAAAPRRRPGEKVVFRDDFAAIAGWERRGVIMSRSLPWESSLLQDPCLVYGEGGGPLFKMWYGSLHAVGYATSDDGVHWTKAAEPVLTPTLPSESNALNQPSVVHRDGRWHMTYFGVAGDGNGQIHYATADDPAGPWEKHGVVLTSTMPWEDRWIYNSSLIYDATAHFWKRTGRCPTARRSRCVTDTRCPWETLWTAMARPSRAMCGSMLRTTRCRRRSHPSARVSPTVTTSCSRVSPIATATTTPASRPGGTSTPSA